MEHDFKAALRETKNGFFSLGMMEDARDQRDEANKIKETIRFALRLAERLMQEPSDGVIDAGAGALDAWGSEIDDAYKAMRDQLIKEVEDDQTVMSIAQFPWRI